jgi:hypothetical protein
MRLDITIKKTRFDGQKRTISTALCPCCRAEFILIQISTPKNCRVYSMVGIAAMFGLEVELQTSRRLKTSYIGERCIFDSELIPNSLIYAI